jgi:hypothetical protein
MFKRYFILAMTVGLMFGGPVVAQALKPQEKLHSAPSTVKQRDPKGLSRANISMEQPPTPSLPETANDGAKENAPGAVNIRTRKATTKNPCNDLLSDLCQQARMAQAAESQIALIAKQNTLIKSQLSISLFEMIGLCVSLLVSALALFFSIMTNRKGHTTSQAELRAYISIAPSTIFPFSATTPLRAHFEFQNHGSTPAFDTRAIAAIDILPEPLPKDFHFPDLPTPRSAPVVVFKDQTFGGSSEKRSLSSFEITEVLSGTSRIYVYGIVTYRDAFGVSRRTRFARSVEAPPSVFQRLSTGYEVEGKDLFFASAEHHNDAS